MPFEDIPFADLEKRIFIEVGAWRSYDDLEDCLTLDELLLTQEAIEERFKQQVKIQAALAGGDPDTIFPDDELRDLGEVEDEDFQALLEFEMANYKPRDEFADLGIKRILVPAEP